MLKSDDQGQILDNQSQTHRSVLRKFQLLTCCHYMTSSNAAQHLQTLMFRLITCYVPFGLPKYNVVCMIAHCLCWNTFNILFGVDFGIEDSWNFNGSDEQISCIVPSPVETMICPGSPTATDIPPCCGSHRDRGVISRLCTILNCLRVNSGRCSIKRSYCEPFLNIYVGKSALEAEGH